MKPNVILITVDSLRADHLGFMGYDKNISPSIDKLALESSIFRQAFSTGPVTPHSFPGILTSTYPFDYQGVRKIEKPRILISELLNEHGFMTAAFHSNPYLSEYFGYNKGWDYFEDITLPLDTREGRINKEEWGSIIKNLFEKLLKSIAFNTLPELYFIARYISYKVRRQESELKVRADFINSVVKDFLNASKSQNRPLFAWIHYMDLHIPYISIDRYTSNSKMAYSEMVSSYYCSASLPNYYDKKALIKFGKRYVGNAIDLYDGQIVYTDKQIGDLLEFLKTEGYYDDSIICFTADHGDEFFEHNGLSHTSKLYNELLHVPLLVKFPQSKMRKVVHEKKSLIDLAPTLCDLLDIPKVAFKGRNLFEKSEPIIFHQTTAGVRAQNLLVENMSECKFACQSEEWKYIIDYSTDKEELYDLVNDAGEHRELSACEVGTLSDMRKIVQGFVNENAPFCLL
jgi:arylsulfatase A-like enzyme